jgi:hypothetical protein
MTQIRNLLHVPIGFVFVLIYDSRFVQVDAL